MKNKIINEIIRIEGDYVDDPQDSGGETKYGITNGVAYANGYRGELRDMPRAEAFNIYAVKYWDAVRADDLLALSLAVTEEVVDTSVNMGPNRAGKFLQRALNALNDRAKLYPDIKIDGSIGPATISTLHMYLRKRDAETLVKMLNCMQGSFYVVLAERREKDEQFIYGWFKNRVKL